LFQLLDKLTGCEDDFACPVWPCGRKFFYKEDQLKKFCPSVKMSFYPAENLKVISDVFLQIAFEII